ncbi:MAG TPA: ABC transporter permease, partial [Acidobacteriaceae bacterium]|nr:ABC transporter permease [Acidobacteriaceae bacterium]
MLRSSWVYQVLRDIRYSMRQLRSAPVFTLAVTLTLGLGIGATTAIFSLIHSVMLKNLPVADPSNLYLIGSSDTCCATTVLQGDWQSFSYSLYKRIAASTSQFDDIAAFQQRAGILSVRDAASDTAQARAMMGEYVSGNYFRTLGLKAAAGRLIMPADDTRNAPPVAVLSYRTWLRDYNASPAVIGSVVKIETYPFTIIGIAPPGFYGETLSSEPPELWITLQSEFLIDGKAAFNLVPSTAWLHLIGHLRPGASLDGIPEQLSTTLQNWIKTEADLPPRSQPKSLAELERQVIRIAPGGAGIGTMRQAYSSSLWLLFALCIAVLLIACANVANLMLARGVTHRSRIAVQLALGASRQRVLRQALTECMLLALFGGSAGVGISLLGTRMAIALAFRHAANVPLHAALSWPVLGFCLGLSLITGFAFGVGPAWLASRANPIECLRGVNRSTRASTAFTQKALVVLQTALSILLIAAAGALTHSLLNLERQELGFKLLNRLEISMEPPLADYTLEDLTTRYRTLLVRLRQLPGVRSASLALDGPTSAGWGKTVMLPGEATMSSTDDSHSTRWNRVSPGYFETVGIPIIAGRGFIDSDRDDTPGVAVVNEAFAKKFFGNQSPIGKHFGPALPSYANSLEIVGVVRDAKSGDLTKPVQPMAFGALTQHINYKETTLQGSDKWDHFITSVQILHSGNAGALDTQIRDAFRQADPNFAILSIQPVSEEVDTQLDQQHTVAELSGLFGVLALILASIGLYGVTAYTVAQRTREIGIRMAIGADRLHIVLFVLRGAFIQVAIGAAIGLPAALLVSRLFSTMLYHVGTFDPASLTTAIVA